MAYRIDYEIIGNRLGSMRGSSLFKGTSLELGAYLTKFASSLMGDSRDLTHPTITKVTTVSDDFSFMKVGR